MSVKVERYINCISTLSAVRWLVSWDRWTCIHVAPGPQVWRPLSAWIIITGPSTTCTHPWPWLGGEWSGSTAVVLWCCCLQPPHPDNQVMYFLTSTAALGHYTPAAARPQPPRLGTGSLSTIQGWPVLQQGGGGAAQYNQQQYHHHCTIFAEGS